MAIKMGLNLALGFGKKAKVPFITQGAGEDTHRQRTEIPQRVEKTLPPPQFGNPRFRPGKMLRFLFGSSTQRIPDSRIPRGQGLPLV